MQSEGGGGTVHQIDLGEVISCTWGLNEIYNHYIIQSLGFHLASKVTKAISCQQYYLEGLKP